MFFTYGYSPCFKFSLLVILLIYMCIITELYCLYLCIVFDICVIIRLFRIIEMFILYICMLFLSLEIKSKSFSIYFVNFRISTIWTVY